MIFQFKGNTLSEALAKAQQEIATGDKFIIAYRYVNGMAVILLERVV